MSMTFAVLQDTKYLHNDVEETFEGETYTVNAWSLNVANGNAFALADILKFEIRDGYTEICDVVEFKRICLATLCMLRMMPELDSGRKDIIHQEPGHAMIVECAMHDGYLQDRISKLIELSDIAIQYNAKIVGC